MNAPADRTAKRLGIDEWMARKDALEMLRTAPADRRVKAREDLRRTPGDRVAVRT